MIYQSYMIHNAKLHADAHYHCYMNDLERLQALIDQNYAGNQAAFARAIGRQPAQVNQYLKGRRQLGIEAKLHIEQALQLHGWFGISSADPPTQHPPPSASAPPDHAQAVDIDTGLTPEALVGALADRLNAFEDLAQREVVAEKLRALAFYPDSAKARADVAQALSRTSMAAPAAAGTAERVLKAKLKTETKEFTRQGSTTHDRDND